MKSIYKSLVLGLILGLSFMVSNTVFSGEATYLVGNTSQAGDLRRSVNPTQAIALVPRFQYLGDGTVVEYTEAPPSPDGGFSATLLADITDIIVCEQRSYPTNRASVEGVTQCHLDLSKTKRVKLLEDKSTILDLAGLAAQQKELGFNFAFRSGNGLVWAVWGKVLESNNTYEKFFK